MAKLRRRKIAAWVTVDGHRSRVVRNFWQSSLGVVGKRVSKGGRVVPKEDKKLLGYIVEKGQRRPKPDGSKWAYLTEEEAMIMHARRLDDHQHGRPSSHARAALFEEAAREYLAAVKVDEELRKGTRVSIRHITNNHLIPRFGRFPVTAITLGEIERFAADQRAKGYSKATVTLHLAKLKAILRDQVRHKKMSADDLPEWPRKKKGKQRPERAEKPVLLTDEQFAAGFAAASDRMRLFAALAWYQGLRYSEALFAEWSRFNKAKAVYKVETGSDEEAFAVKTVASDREIDLHPLVVELFEAYQGRTRFKSPYVFADEKTGAAPRISTMRYQWEKFCRAVGWPSRYHWLRHAWATRMHRDGMSLRDVMYYGGWSSADMLLEIYAHEQREHAAAVLRSAPKPEPKRNESPSASRGATE